MKVDLASLLRPHLLKLKAMREGGEVVNVDIASN
jgi:hypothetical protein